MNEAVRSAAITSEQLAVLKGSEWFGALEPAFQEAMLASSRVKLLASGETVFHRGDASDGIYCVLSGAVCFGAIAPSGRGSIVALAEAPQWFGEVACSTAARAPMTPGPTSLRPCSICRCVT
jgi:CRP/FNR family cyclic AMP-dependent transcriptional regulator